MARPVIALLTDFGTSDHYVGAIKGVALDICPEATLVDITHSIAPQDILEAALELAAAYRFFPPHTVFLAVVDPGVGSSRRGVAVEIARYRFVAPDNGVLTAVLQAHDAWRAVELTNPQYALPTISRTFEGRDRFAPVAAWLARGVDVSELGPAVTDLQMLVLPHAVERGGILEGHVLRIDRFGNAITDIHRATLDEFVPGRTLRIEVGSHVLTRIVQTYSAVEVGDVCALVGSTERLEIARNGGSACALLGLVRGSPVRLSHAD
jgi:S-adenosylmethionine hydrolase